MMKKIYLAIIAILALTVTSVKAEEGVIDLSGVILTDIDGRSWDLDSLENEGIIVVYDFWATWCGPCINSIPTMETLMDDHGPDGDNTMIILSIETDAGTSNEVATIAQHGMTNPQFLMEDQGGQINPSMFAYTGGIPYYVVVCPNGYWQDRTGGIGNGAATQFPELITDLAAACENHDDRDAFAFKLDVSVASCPGTPTNSWSPADFEFANLAETNMTEAVIEVKIDGVVTEIIEWTGDLAQSTTETVPVSDIDFYGMGSQELEINIYSVNGGVDENPSDNAKSYIRGLYFTDQANITLEIKTDVYPDETTWELRNGANAVVASGGPYDGQTNTIVTENITLADVNDCHTFTLFDGFGDGIYDGGGYRLLRGTDVIVANYSIFEDDISDKFLYAGDTDNDGFVDLIENLAGSNATDMNSTPDSDIQDVVDSDNDGYSDDIEIANGSNPGDANSDPHNPNVAVIDNDLVNTFNVYPNPTTDILNVAITTNSAVVLNVDMVDILGRTVATANVENGIAVFNTSSINTGVYFVNVKESGKSVATSTVVVE